MNVLLGVTAGTPTTLVGIAAIVTALGGIASTVMALRKNRSEEYEHVLEELKESRAESERLAQELHDLRMMQVHQDLEDAPPE